MAMTALSVSNLLPEFLRSLLELPLVLSIFCGSAVLFVLMVDLVFAWSTDVKSAPPAKHPNQSPTRDSEEIDPFFYAVAIEKKRADSAISVAQQQYERELKTRLTRFADDVKVKERLSKFAGDSNLPRVLIEVWQTIRYYPAWSSRDAFAKWNQLHLTGISGSKNGNIESVEFAHGDQRFKIAERRWYDMVSECPCSDISLFEDSEEVFAISCSLDADKYGCGITDYRFYGVSAAIPALIYSNQ